MWWIWIQLDEFKLHKFSNNLHIGIPLSLSWLNVWNATKPSTITKKPHKNKKQTKKAPYLSKKHLSNSELPRPLCTSFAVPVSKLLLPSIQHLLLLSHSYCVLLVRDFVYKQLAILCLSTLDSIWNAITLVRILQFINEGKSENIW